MKGNRRDDGSAGLAWNEKRNDRIDKEGSYLVVDYLTGEMVALMRQNHYWIALDKSLHPDRSYLLFWAGVT
jgi:hypothetical protein